MSVSDVVMSLEMSGFPGSTSKGLSKIGDLLRCRACPGRMYFMFLWQFKRAGTRKSF